MKVKEYKKNRELFKQVAKESPEGREKVEAIRRFKFSSDDELDSCVGAGVLAALFASLAVMLATGVLHTEGAWPTILTALNVFLAGACCKWCKTAYNDSKSASVQADKLIKKLVDEKQVTL